MGRKQNLEIMVTPLSIHCDGCESRIQNVLGELVGISVVVADHNTNSVRLEHRPDKISEDEIRARLEEMGFPPVQNG